jgi:hypothetical protein
MASGAKSHPAVRFAPFLVAAALRAGEALRFLEIPTPSPLAEIISTFCDFSMLCSQENFPRNFQVAPHLEHWLR